MVLKVTGSTSWLADPSLVMKSLTSVLFTLDIWNNFEILSVGILMPMLQIRRQSLRLKVLLGVPQVENGIAGLSYDKAMIF